MITKVSHHGFFVHALLPWLPCFLFLVSFERGREVKRFGTRVVAGTVYIDTTGPWNTMGDAAYEVKVCIVIVSVTMCIFSDVCPLQEDSLLAHEELVVPDAGVL